MKVALVWYIIKAYTGDMVVVSLFSLTSWSIEGDIFGIMLDCPLPSTSSRSQVPVFTTVLLGQFQVDLNH